MIVGRWNSGFIWLGKIRAEPVNSQGAVVETVSGLRVSSGPGIEAVMLSVVGVGGTSTTSVTRVTG